MKRNKTPDYRGQHVFGVPPLIHVQRTGQPLPQSIQQAMRYLRSQCLDQVSPPGVPAERWPWGETPTLRNGWGAALLCSFPLGQAGPSETFPSLRKARQGWARSSLLLLSGPGTIVPIFQKPVLA